MLRISRERFIDTPVFIKMSILLTPLYTKLPGLYYFICKFFSGDGFYCCSSLLCTELLPI